MYSGFDGGVPVGVFDLSSATGGFFVASFRVCSSAARSPGAVSGLVTRVPTDVVVITSPYRSNAWTCGSRQLCTLRRGRVVPGTVVAVFAQDLLLPRRFLPVNLLEPIYELRAGVAPLSHAGPVDARCAKKHSLCGALALWTRCSCVRTSNEVVKNVPA